MSDNWSKNDLQAAKMMLPLQGALAGAGPMGAILSAAANNQVKRNALGMPITGPTLIDTTKKINGYGFDMNDLPLGSSSWRMNPLASPEDNSAAASAKAGQLGFNQPAPWEDGHMKKFEKAVEDATSVLEQNTRIMRTYNSDRSSFNPLIVR